MFNLSDCFFFLFSATDYASLIRGFVNFVLRTFCVLFMRLKDAICITGCKRSATAGQ